MKPRDTLEAATTLWRTFGPAGAWCRARFVLRSAIGRYRAAPSPVPERVRVAAPPSAWPFRANAERLRATTDRDVARFRCARVMAGEHEAYRAIWMSRPTSPGEWNVNPLSGRRYPDAPWFRVPHYAPGVGDIKAVWEASRFAWTYDLIRAWLVEREPRAPETFWLGFESFLDGAPPFRGVQWACGQETAIRAIAWLWAECAFADAAATTGARLGRLREALAWAAERIDDGHDWAASQRNNHGISEALGLIAIGARLEGADPRATEWSRRGRRLLERYILDQFAPDGWFIQHSFTYARLALDHVVLAARVLHARNQELSPEAQSRVRAAMRLLMDVMDPANGHVPLHGANDGAFVLPLTTAPYRDFRPSITAAAVTLGEPVSRSMPIDRETLAWLDADEPPRGPDPELPRVHVGASGWVHAVTRGARLFARAGHYRSRPGQIDPLHTDIWIDGRPVAIDAGTYRYNDVPPWNNGLAGIEVHNTLSIDDHPPARRGPRFLWLRWPSARVIGVETTAPGRIEVRLENTSWLGLGCRHRRTCTIEDAGIVVLDEVIAPTSLPLTATVHWLLDGPSDLVAVEAPIGAEVIEATGDARSVFGWVSETYGNRRPATSVRVRAPVDQGRLRVVSCFGAARTSRDERAREVEGAWTSA